VNLYKISQTDNDDWDTYDSAIVCAASEDDARQINPGGRWNSSLDGWCKSPDLVTVELLGTANDDIPAGVVLSSFNAG